VPRAITIADKLINAAGLRLGRDPKSGSTSSPVHGHRPARRVSGDRPDEPTPEDNTVIENTRGAYQAVSKALVAARRDGTIPWPQIEDRLRKPRCVSMWDGLGDFAATAACAYRRNTVGRSASSP
jgi:hypothetical protein